MGETYPGQYYQRSCNMNLTELKRSVTLEIRKKILRQGYGDSAAGFRIVMEKGVKPESVVIISAYVFSL
jgi:hypothetical protein